MSELAPAVPQRIVTRWSRSHVFLMACVGMVVGFSNFWTFPALMVQFGGFAFLSSYCLSLLLFAMPLMALQLLIGKRLAKPPVAALLALGGTQRYSLGWCIAAVMLAAVFLTLIIYSVVAGISIAYGFKSAFGEFRGASVMEVTQLLGYLQQDIDQLLAWITLFIGLVFVIAWRGVYAGLGTAMQYIVPLATLFTLVLVFYSVSLDTMPVAWQSLFNTEFAGFGLESILAGARQAFFSLALGAGVFILLGAYMPPRAVVRRAVASIVLVDLVVGVLAGLILIPWVLYTELPTSQGFTLLFQVVPYALSSLPSGQFVGVMLFVLMALVALSSALVLVEVLVTALWHRTQYSRKKSIWILLFLVWSVAAVLVLSVAMPERLGYGNVPLFSWIQMVTGSLLLPMTGTLLLALCGYVMPASRFHERLGIEPDNFGQAFYRWLKYGCFPLLIVLQIFFVLDSLKQSCQFENVRSGALCAPAATVGSLPEKVDALGLAGLEKQHNAGSPVVERIFYGGGGLPPAESIERQDLLRLGEESFMGDARAVD